MMHQTLLAIVVLVSGLWTMLGWACHEKHEATELHHAACVNDTTTAKLQIAAGADVHAKDKNGNTPLHFAAWHNAADVARVLIDAGTDLHAKNKKDDIPLHYAAGKNAADVARMLIDAGTNLHAKNKKDDTPLHYAAWKNAADAARVLIDAGADVNVKDTNGLTPLQVATRDNSDKVVHLLKDAETVSVARQVANAVGVKLDATGRLHLGDVCDYFGLDGDEIPKAIFPFKSSRQAEQTIDDIVSKVGIKGRNFRVLAGGVPNAAADVQGEQRLIIYNPGFMNKMRSETGTDWAAVSIMAHEIGHHLEGHTLKAGGSRPKIELEADEFSGHVLQKLGASLEQAQIVMKTLESETGSRTHPAKRDRLAAIASGWEKSCEEDPNCRQVALRCRSDKVARNGRCEPRCRDDEEYRNGQCEFNVIMMRYIAMGDANVSAHVAGETKSCATGSANH